MKVRSKAAKKGIRIGKTEAKIIKKLRKKERKKQINNYSAFVHIIQIYLTITA
jgi:hypothetical protein